MRERNIGVCIVLTIVTCGIYGLYWLVCLADDINSLTNKNGMSGGMVLLLSIVTCGIYSLYWMYVSGAAIDEYKGTHDYTGIIYLVLSILGFGIVSYALMQNELNKLALNK